MLYCVCHCQPQFAGVRVRLGALTCSILLIRHCGTPPVRRRCRPIPKAEPTTELTLIDAFPGAWSLRTSNMASKLCQMHQAKNNTCCSRILILIDGKQPKNVPRNDYPPILQSSLECTYNWTGKTLSTVKLKNAKTQSVHRTTYAAAYDATVTGGSVFSRRKRRTLALSDNSTSTYDNGYKLAGNDLPYLCCARPGIAPEICPRHRWCQSHRHIPIRIEATVSYVDGTVWFVVQAAKLVSNRYFFKKIVKI